jgi:DNA-binding NtrC family response regulator
MTTIKTTNTASGNSCVFERETRLPVLLVAFVPEGTCTVDRCVISDPLTVGRSSKCNFTILDDKISKSHFRIFRHRESFVVEDLGSTNGTFVSGAPLAGSQTVKSNSVIRAGRAVLVFHSAGAPIMEPPPTSRFGISGSFHVGPLLDNLKDAARSVRHVLLVGPSGTGKELAARAIGAMTKSTRVVAHNAARFSSEEEATATIFGVGPKVFSGVAERAGLIEQADGGLLFLDEVHNLPQRVQRSLLRVIEEGTVARIGVTEATQVNVRFVFASNAPGETHGLAHDLFARLRSVEMPPLVERVADVPTIFDTVLKHALARYDVDINSVIPLLGGDHYEALCLDGFPSDNVRGLIDLADRIATKIAGGGAAKKTIASIFSDRLGDGAVAKRSPSSPDEAGSDHYESSKDLILAAFRETKGNISATERLLKSRSVRCSRRWLAVYLERWGVK